MDYELSENDLNIGTGDGDSGNAGLSTEPQPSETNTTQQVQMFKYPANGREIEEPLDVILKRASQGYNYAQHMEGFKRQQTELEQKRLQVEEQEKRWREYDEYARSNPEWANHVRNAWENRTSFNSNEQTGVNQNLPPEIVAELNELKQFRNEFKTHQENLKREREDLALNEQIESVRKEYPDIDLSYTDPESGKSLEWQIIEHAQANGISNFKSAFRDFYHDKLMSRAVTKAKEDAAKELQTRQQKGFIAQSDTPMLKNSSGRSTRNMSYFDLAIEGGKEMGFV